ncbi:MAG: hypothetical protein LBB68_06835 [Treponema sp.]|jgi:hypothetical protein|nr:hypothetical protein [Treponema sp.]
MNKIKSLLHSYEQYIAIPWRDDAAPAQRVIFCIYNENNERVLRVKIEEFDIATTQAGHDWALFDLTNTFAVWLGSQKYAVKYFEQPNLLNALYPNYLRYLAGEFRSFLLGHSADSNTVVAVEGVASLFGILKVKDVVDAFAPLVKGRLLVFFPGSFDNNNYRLLDGYDGWNYLAVPITADKEF